MEPLDETTSLLPHDDTSGTQNPLAEEYHKHNLLIPKGPVLVALWLGSFISSLDGTVVANIMNKVAEEFSESDKKQWMATSFLLTNTAFQPLYGKLSDVTGRKFALLTSYFFFSIGCVLTCFAQNVTQFAVARAICGIGGGGMNACSSIIVSDICSAKERGIYQGYANIVFGLGQMLGGPLGGLFIDTIGWRAIFGVQVPIVIICSIVAFMKLDIKLIHVPPVSERFTLKNLSRIDIFGSLSLTACICGLIFLCSTDINKLILAIFTLSSFILFMWVELYYAKERILPLELLRGSFGLCSVATLTSSFIIFGDIFRSPIYLQLIHNIGVTRSGLYMIFPSISIAAGSLATGWVLRHTKMDLARCSYMIVFGGLCLQLFGLLINTFLTSVVNPSTSTTDVTVASLNLFFPSDCVTWKIIYVFASVCVGFGYACLLVATLVSIVFSIEKSQQATMTGIFYLWRSIGNVLGAALTLVIFENSLGKMLWNYMFNNPDGPDYEFKQEEYDTLLQDSSYLREHFPSSILKILLKIYRSAFLASYMPNIGMSIIGILASAMLVKTYRTSKPL